MKSLLIAVSALAMSASVALARDVNSTAPDDGELGSQPTITQPVAGDYVFKPASARHVQYPEHVIIKNDPATQPD